MMIYKNWKPKNINQIYNLLYIRRMMSDDKKITSTKDIEKNIKVKFLTYFN